MAECEEAIEDFEEDTFPAFLPDDNGRGLSDDAPFQPVNRDEAGSHHAAQLQQENQEAHELDQDNAFPGVEALEVGVDADHDDADPARFDVGLNFDQDANLLHGGQGQDEEDLLEDVREENTSPALKVYLEAVNAVLAKQAGKDGMKGFVDVSRRALEAWKEMTEVERSPWEEKAKESPAQAKPRQHTKKVPADQQVLFATGSTAKGKKGKAKAKAASAKKESKPPKAPKAAAKKPGAPPLPAGFNFFCAEHRAQLQAEKRKATDDDPNCRVDEALWWSSPILRQLGLPILMQFGLANLNRIRRVPPSFDADEHVFGDVFDGVPGDGPKGIPGNAPDDDDCNVNYPPSKMLPPPLSSLCLPLLWSCLQKSLSLLLSLCCPLL